MTNPTTMKAWLYSQTTGGLEKNLTLTTTAPAPPALKNNQILIRVLTAALNPADYKVPAMPIVNRLLISKPASPCIDFAGEVAATGAGVSEFTTGQIVFGDLGLPTKFGTLGEYVVTVAENLCAVPEGVEVDHASTVGVAGQTAWQSIAPYVTAGAGEKVLIIGGSGGCGTFAIQIAKALGCVVTTTCSTKNVEFVKSLGADEVIDYTTEDVVGVLKAKGQVFSHVVDHIGEPADLYRESDKFLLPGKVFAQVGANWMPLFAVRLLRPAFLGGGRRRYVPLFWKSSKEDLGKVGELIKEGKVKVVLDSVFEFEDAPKAFEKLRLGRARGKIVVHVAERE
ncbi:zinc alcohol dehydrogenase [Aspergillus heteromorphus CBS 117.55]|uniref:Zinc alcohol dehydrogenase n=1 Tax=Aspergillus heteromorphus CBS 117.55 TaxID=1448321 RepID=A0A317VVI9_9EURO|nr:zinc alcohol dehydrogenase [Aspergillus heteromorphus CBS 117.55]PWY76982.1 zinc alcohol dehydrogenase [Aspergillus heteromorphus CBS 117.55]